MSKKSQQKPVNGTEWKGYTSYIAFNSGNPDKPFVMRGQVYFVTKIVTNSQNVTLKFNYN